MECVAVDVCILHEARPKPIQERVRCFMHDDVVRETGVDQLPRYIAARFSLGCRKLSEGQSNFLVVVVGVGFLHSMGEYREGLLFRGAFGAEPNLSAQRTIKVAQHVADNRVNHLLVELRVPVAGFDSAVSDDVRMLQINRRMQGFSLETLIDHPHATPDGAGLQRFKGNAKNQVIAAAPAKPGMEGIDSQRPIGRFILTKGIRPAELGVAIRGWSHGSLVVGFAVLWHQSVSIWKSIQKSPDVQPEGNFPVLSLRTTRSLLRVARAAIRSGSGIVGNGVLCVGTSTVRFSGSRLMMLLGVALWLP